MDQITPSLDSLPKQFVAAMRTLFDIMDDKRTGFVRLTDIENRWRDDRTRGLPTGVIESLQKVASLNGLLTFDRFCAGLNLCLLRNQTEKGSRNMNIDGDTLKSHNMQRPPSAPMLAVAVEEHEPSQSSNLYSMHAQATEGVHIHQHRTISMPHLIPRPDQLIVDEQVLRYGMDGMSQKMLPKPHIYGPPKPPRADKPQLNNETNEIISNFTKHEHHSNNDSVGKGDLKLILSSDTATQTLLSRGGRGPGDGKPAADPAPAIADMVHHKKTTRRREPRRHTLQNGIDYNVLKRMKQIEQEKDILVQGLAAVEKAREWYLKQLAEVQDKMRYASRMGTHVEQWTEAQQERLELQRARVLELNRQLAALADSWRSGGLSLHMNLALQPHPHAPRPTLSAAAAALKHQNHLLTEEVTKKTERISVLEREKSTLITNIMQNTQRECEGICEGPAGPSTRTVSNLCNQGVVWQISE